MISPQPSSPEFTIKSYPVSESATLSYLDLLYIPRRLSRLAFCLLLTFGVGGTVLTPLLDAQQTAPAQCSPQFRSVSDPLAELQSISFESRDQRASFQQIYIQYDCDLSTMLQPGSVAGKRTASQPSPVTDASAALSRTLELHAQVSALKQRAASQVAKSVSPAAALHFVNYEPLTARAFERIATYSIVQSTADSTLRQDAKSGASGTTSARPKIGLVLGGGGARGAAHVGILKVLEEEKIPIDYISGTSMGAIVGAAYAAGLSPAEIEQILLSINWRDTFTDAAPRADLSFRDKMDERRFVGLELGVRDGGIVLPHGAFAGRKLQFLLKSVYLHTAHIKSFDELAIPFRAVATNIESGEAVVLKDGDLAMAVRASMSIPGAFPPVEIDGALVDGYVSMNLPIDVIRSMGADVVIAVDVGTPLSKRSGLTSMMSIVNQVGGIATIKNVEEQVRTLTANDLLLRPDLGDHSTIDFENIAEIIPLGEGCARKHIDAIRHFATDEKSYQKFQQHQRNSSATLPMIDFIEVIPTIHVSAARVSARLGLTAGKQLDLQELSAALDRVQAIEEFEQVGFELVERDGRTGLIIKPVEKSWGPHFVRAGMNITTDFENDTIFNALFDYTRLGINSLGAEWRTQLQAGQTMLVSSEFYQPLEDSGSFFIAPHMEFRQDLADIYEGADRIAEYRVRRYGAGPDVGYQFGSIAELRGGAWFGKASADRSTGSADLPEVDIDQGAATFRFTYDQVDNANFPKHGAYLRTDGWYEREGLGAELNYEKYTVNALAPFTFGRHTILPRVLAGFDPEDRIPYYAQFTLGGANSLSGYHTDQLRGGQMLLGKLVYYYQLSNQYFSFARSSYLGFSLDQGNVWEQHSDIALDDMIFGGSIFYGIESVLGPVFLNYGMNEDLKEGIVTFSLGQRL